jgi:hypothetical protein
MKAFPLASAHVENESEENGQKDMDAFETSPVADEEPVGPEEDKNEAEENGPQDMDAYETSPVAGYTLHGPEEDKTMEACLLASAHVKNEAEENGPRDMDAFETSLVAGDAQDDAPDVPVDIGKEVLDDRDSKTSSAYAHDPTHAMSNNVEATAVGHPLKIRRSMITPTTLVQYILSTSLTSPGQTPKMNPNHPLILKGQG